MARHYTQAHVRGRAYILAAGQCHQGNDARLLMFVSYGGGFRGGRSTSDVNAASALLSSSLPWLKPPPPPRRGARDNDNGKVNNVDVVGVDRQQPVGIHLAGGWVRDKLLNQHSANVNVALDCMMKVQFARIVQRYMALLAVAVALSVGVAVATMVATTVAVMVAVAVTVTVAVAVVRAVAWVVMRAMARAVARAVVKAVARAVARAVAVMVAVMVVVMVVVAVVVAVAVTVWRLW
jgi:hypothetical protein